MSLDQYSIACVRNRHLMQTLRQTVVFLRQLCAKLAPNPAYIEVCTRVYDALTPIRSHSSGFHRYMDEGTGMGFN